MSIFMSQIQATDDLQRFHRIPVCHPDVYIVCLSKLKTVGRSLGSFGTLTCSGGKVPLVFDPFSSFELISMPKHKGWVLTGVRKTCSKQLVGCTFGES